MRDKSTPPAKIGLGRISAKIRQPKEEETGSTRRDIEIGQAARRISTGRLKGLLPLHLRPIDLVVYKEPLGG